MTGQGSWEEVAWELGTLVARFLEEFSDMCRGSDNGSEARRLLAKLSVMAGHPAEDKA